MNPIRHIEFWSSNIERSMDFYESFLGILGWKRTDNNGLSCEGTKIYFREANIPIQNTLGPRHICFNANDPELIDQVSVSLKQKEALILHGPAELHPGNYMIVFKDPDGYILEISHKANG